MEGGGEEEEEEEEGRERRRRRRQEKGGRGGRKKGVEGERGGIRVVHSKTDAEDSVLSVNQYCSHVTILTTPTFQMCFTHLDVLLGLVLLQSLVVVRLQLDQRAEYVLVLVGILVAMRGSGGGGGREGGRREGGMDGEMEGGGE